MAIDNRTCNLNFEPASVISFDIFDTVLTRITADPKGVFFKIRERILATHPEVPEAIVSRFVEIRMEMERIARRRNAREEIRFEDIYMEMGVRYGLGEDLLVKLMDLEIETELEYVRRIPSNVDRVRELKRQGKRIIFISDMYLPLIVIRRLLEKVDLLGEADEIYVSSEHGLTKSSGNLFISVLEKERCSASQLLHIGDNYRSDYLMARRVGRISAHHYDEGGFSRFERILREPFGDALELSWQLIAGASRVARLHAHEQTDKHRRALHIVGANVVGPVLWGFVSWVLEQATARNIRKLYFVARDGQILYEVAARIREAVGCDIELRYLYGSRQAWHLPAVAEITEREIHWITVKDPFLSLRLIATRLSMDPSTLALQFCGTGFPLVDLDQELSEQQVVQLRSLLRTSKELQDLISASAEQRRREVIAYLDQEGLMDETTWAIVDSGWNGRLQDSLGKILSMAGRQGEVIGFYIGLLSKPCSYTSKLAYLFSPDVSTEYLKWGSAVINLLELVMSADHGVTLSYRRDSSGRWHPVLATETPNLISCMGLTALRDGVFNYLEHLDHKTVRIEHSRFREKIIRLLKVFYLAPSRDVAIALGRLPFSTDQTEKNFLPFAPLLSLKDAFHFALKSSSRERFALTFWIHGSRVQSSWLVNVFLSITSLAYRCSRYVKELVYGGQSPKEGTLQ